VPINVAKEVVRQILESGKVTRSTIGLSLQPLQDLETFFDVGKTEGAIVSSVEPDGPADKAGIRAQDVFIAYGGAPVEGRYPEQLFDTRRRVSDTPVGSKVPIKVKRGGQVLDLELVTEELTTVRGDEENFPKWGLVAQDITDRLAQREKLPTTDGVYVTGVRQGEPAEKGGLARGDAVVGIGSQPVKGIKDFKKAYDDAVRKKEAMVLLRVRRGQGVLPVLIRADYGPPPKPPAKKPDAPKAEPKKEDAPKPEEPKKEDAPKPEEPKKEDAPKAEAPKPEQPAAPKPEEPKPPPPPAPPTPPEPTPPEPAAGVTCLPGAAGVC
jgi:S1-C subfamily serine protease